MALRDFRVLTFDVVGTLIDCERGILAYLRQALPGAAVTDHEFLCAFRAVRRQLGAKFYLDDLERCWHGMAQQLGLPDTDALAGGLRDSVAFWPSFPDSVQALQRLSRLFRMVALANAQSWALAHFDKTLGHPFDMLISCDDALCEKPDPSYFAYARGRYEGAWGYRQTDNLHVAQSLLFDIGVARRLGIATCWIDHRQDQSDAGYPQETEPVKPDYHFHRLEQLADALEAGL